MQFKGFNATEGNNTMNLFRKSRTGWLLISLFVFNAAYAEEQGRETSVSWHQFKSEEGRFSIQFPTLPAIKTHDQNSIIGHVTNHLFESRSHLGDFSVDYSDLPGFAITFTGNETIYSHATGALLKDTLGKLKSSKDFNYQGHPELAEESLFYPAALHLLPLTKPQSLLVHPGLMEICDL